MTRPRGLALVGILVVIAGLAAALATGVLPHALDTLLEHRRLIVAGVAGSGFLIALLIGRKFGEFLWVAVAATLLGLAWIEQRIDDQSPVGSAGAEGVRSRFPVVDVHFHRTIAHPSLPVEELIAGMNAVGIRAVVNLDDQWVDGRPTVTGRFQRRIPTFINLQPGDPTDPAYRSGQLVRIDSAQRAGVRGIVLPTVLGTRVFDGGGGLSLDDPQLEFLWEAADRLDLAVQLHVDNEADLDGDARFIQRGRLLSRHPGVTLIAPIGVKQDDLTWAARLLDEHPNYRVELSSLLAEPSRHLSPPREFMITYHRRILFGSQGHHEVIPSTSALRKMYRAQFQYLESSLNLPDSVLAHIYHLNAERLLAGALPAHRVSASSPVTGPIQDSSLLAGIDRKQLLVFLAALVGYAIAAPLQQMEHLEYAYLADAFLRGRLSILDPPPAFIDAVPVGTEYYLPYGIMPAVLLMPLVALLGVASRVQMAATILVGALNVAVAYRVLGRLPLKPSARTWLLILFGFGSANFLASAWGGPWFLMHLVAVLFLLLAIDEVLGRGRWFLVGTWFGCATLSRNPVILAVPFFLLLLWRDKQRWSHALDFAAGLVPCMVVGMWYNLARFGNPTDNGYPRVLLNQPHGMFSPAYLPSNLKTYFLALPDWLGKFPWLRPDPFGVGLFFATPALLYIFRAPIRQRLVIASWVAVIPVAALYLVYFWGGYAQYGPRYALDFSPFLLVLVALGFQHGVSRVGKSLIVLSVVSQLWAVAWWRFGDLVQP